MRLMNGCAIALALTLCSSAAAFAQSVPEIPFDGDVNFLKLPDSIHLGEPSGVAVNSQKHIFVFNRGNTTGRVLEKRFPIFCGD